MMALHFIKDTAEWGSKDFTKFHKFKYVEPEMKI